MAAYADYVFYTKTYGGGAVTEDEFKPLCIQASAVIDRITFGRATETEFVKMAVCAAVDALYDPGEGGRIQSENNDGFSVTYKSRADADKMRSAVTAARIFLPAELTNRGCYCDNQ